MKSRRRIERWPGLQALGHGDVVVIVQRAGVRGRPRWFTLACLFRSTGLSAAVLGALGALTPSGGRELVSFHSRLRRPLTATGFLVLARRVGFDVLVQTGSDAH